MAKANDVEKKSQQDIELERFRKRLSYIKENYSGEDDGSFGASDEKIEEIINELEVFYITNYQYISPIWILRHEKCRSMIEVVTII